jgi:aspartate racemase
MKKKILGILGGMGPAASARFYSLITNFTKAESDGEHIKILISSATDIPDRSDYILGNSTKSPLPKIIQNIEFLEHSGAEVIALPCNTAEYFRETVEMHCRAPILHTVHEACVFAAKTNVKKLGIMATNGTVKAEIYQKELRLLGIDFVLPSAYWQETLHNIIYNGIKRSEKFEISDFFDVANELMFHGCDAIALGCTELSLIPETKKYGKYNFIDSLEILAKSAIKLCGYELR